MSDLPGFNVKAADWRAQIRRNESRTRFVILMFLLLYMGIGLLIDVYINSTPNSQLGTLQLLKALVTFQIVPTVTLIMGGVALISLWITYALHDRLMLLGTEYREITPENAANLEEKQLYNVVEEMKVASGLKYIPKVFIINADYMNAFASGYSEKSAMVAITRGLLEKLDRSELQAVMAHELSHVRHNDIKLTLTASVLSNLMLMALDLLFYNMLFGRSNSDNGRDNKLFLVIVILRYVLPLITVLLMLYLSRTREFMADAGCVELMRDNNPLARALLKIHEDHQENKDAYQEAYGQTAHEDVRRAAYLYDPVEAGADPVKTLASLFSTHPDLKARLAALGVNKPR
jgi:heat shock protein HtpX